jgi:pimeloyl-ACP methyl ester carboxylesterase
MIRVLFVVCVAVFYGCSLDDFLTNERVLQEYRVPTQVTPDSLLEEFSVRSGNETIYGIHVRQPSQRRINPQPTIVYHHGNKHHLVEYWDRVELLYRAGLDVIIYDYRGFGRSTGTSTESSLLADAQAVVEWVQSHPDIDTSFIYAYGYSLGGVPALYHAVELGGVRGIVLEATFASGSVLVRSGTVLDVPRQWLLAGSYDNRQRVARLRVPILHLHGTDDPFLGYQAHAVPLLEVMPQPRTHIAVKGALHNNVPYVMGEQYYMDVMTGFVRGN